MRITEEIKRDGVFWLPSSPDHQVPGTLSISDGGHVKLELTQPIVINNPQQVSPGYSSGGGLTPILGHVEKDGPVMVDQHYRMLTKRNIAHSRLMGFDVILADRVFIGLPYKEDTTPCFNAVSFSVEGIDEWVGISGIEVDEEIEKRALTISYNQPENVTINLQNGMQLLITFAWTPPVIPATKRAEVTQKAYFKLVSQEARELEEFTSIIQKITAFLCFVMNEIVCLDRMWATADNLRETFPDDRTALIPVEIYCPSWPYTKDEPAIDEFDMLFKYEDIQARAESIINKWIDNYEKIAPALDLYFLTKAGTLPTMNIQFLTLAQALEAFHLRTSDEKHMNEAECKEIRKKMIEACPEEHRDWFRPKLQRANELTLRNRIHKMTEPFDSFMGGEHRSKLIGSIVRTRNYLTHYDLGLEQKAAKGWDLEFLCRKMNALFRLHFLKLIGFDGQEIDSIVSKYSSLRSECSAIDVIYAHA